MPFASTDLLSNSVCEGIGVDFSSKTDGIPASGARTRPADNPLAAKPYAFSAKQPGVAGASLISVG